MASTSKRVQLSAVQSNILNYVVNMHGSQANGHRSAWIALLAHAYLISRGSILTESPQSLTSLCILPNGWASTDPIRFHYRFSGVANVYESTSTHSSSKYSLQLSVTQADNNVFVNLTNLTNDKFGHLEISGPGHVRLEAVVSDSALQPTAIFPQLESTLFEMEEKLWKPVFPSPPQSKPGVNPFMSSPPSVVQQPASHPNTGVYPNVPDYGRSDLDPLGGEPGSRLPFGGGGMVIDPTQALRRPNPFGLPHPGGGGMVPPGARYDPIGPPMIPPRGIGPRGGRFNNPDPDSLQPPGWEDMYM
ncbi:unnamed protein product [Mesocestoides corti]|nr:unnamed protein product [Mesocestoides corti]